MDKSLEPTKNIESKPIDELGSLDDQFEDLLNATAHLHRDMQRFALCVDATSSMGHVWSRAKSALKSAVDYIQENSNCPVQIKVVAYRDKDYDKQYVEASEWSSDTRYLHNYIAKMSCHGGGDYEESIGQGFKHLLRDQQRANQIILIGDATGKGDDTGYTEAQAFGQQECPIYALYTNDEPRLVTAFERIARLSGGKAFLLDAEANLKDIFTVLIASNKRLKITYQATSIEGRRMADALK